jgi:tetraacyldisaccharide 4'-kinase
VDLGDLRSKSLAAFCGLARPGSFFGSLSEVSLKMKAHLCLPDHVVYNSDVLSRLTEFKDINNVDFLLTSAKDAVKLPRSLPLPVIILESDLVLERPEGFLEETLGRLDLSPTSSQ